MWGGRQSGIAGALAMLVAGPAVAEDEPVVLPASSAWVVDYADDSCALRRQFGGPDRSVVLEMRQFSPDAIAFQFRVVSDYYRPDGANHPSDVALRFRPEGEFSEVGGAFNLRRNEGWRGITFTHSLFQSELNAHYRESGYDADALEQLIRSFDRPARARQVTAIELRNAFNDDLVLETGSLGAPLGAMDDCLDELLEHWGIDVAAHHSLSRPVRPLDMDSWARRVQETYPLASRGEQAILRIRLSVSIDGRATGCHMQVNMGQEEFERAACANLLQYARFSPALDADANPIASFYLLTIYYSIG